MGLTDDCHLEKYANLSTAPLEHPYTQHCFTYERQSQTSI